VTLIFCVPFQILRILRVIKIICDNSGGHVAQRGLKPTGRLGKEITK
jgi:hypothetical protein